LHEPSAEEVLMVLNVVSGAGETSALLGKEKLGLEKMKFVVE
jgi:hypothetical protein